MTENLKYWLPDADSTHFSGSSLAASLYRPVTITLTGELGAGKTSFAQGFLKELGIAEEITSPTYALENRYNLPTANCQLPTANEVIHIDLYRLTTTQADELILGSGDCNGIRCIEWADRLSKKISNAIEIQLEDSEGGRSLQMQFNDIPVPTDVEIEDWRKEVLLPPHIIAHCEKVAEVAGQFADQLITKGHIIRKHALMQAARLHDLIRFVDFTMGIAFNEYKVSKAQEAKWTEIKKYFDGLGHEEACTAFLTEHGYKEVGEIIRTHGLKLPPKKGSTIEQKLLYYADKRCTGDTFSTLDERFSDFSKRYPDTKKQEEGKIWYAEAKALEEELFAEGSNM